MTVDAFKAWRDARFRARLARASGNQLARAPTLLESPLPALPALLRCSRNVICSMLHKRTSVVNETLANDRSQEHREGMEAISCKSPESSLVEQIPSLSQGSALGKRELSGKHWGFSLENAKELSAKGHEAKRLKKLAIAQALKEAKELKAKIAAMPDPNIYAETRLLRVRGQLDALDDAIQQEVAGGESKRLKELVEAQAKLSEQERILANRPLPGSHRPSSKPTKPRTPESYEPQE